MPANSDLPYEFWREFKAESYARHASENCGSHLDCEWTIGGHV